MSPDATGRHVRLLLVAILAGVLLALFWPSTSLRRASDSCTSSCHTQTAERHLASVGHESADCQECHDVSRGTALRLSISRLLGTQPAQHGAVDSGKCTACHGETDASWADVASTAGHREHASATQVECLSCHRGSLHGGSSAAATCVSCHDDARIHARGVIDEPEMPECLSCHNYSVHDSPDITPGHATTTLEACSSCHAAETMTAAAHVTTNDLHGGVDCKLCHDPHRGQSDKAAQPCINCHRMVIDTANTKLPKEHVICQGCHQGHAPLETAQKRCSECHEQARTLPKMSASTALRHAACSSCHLPHDWKAQPNGCVLCHSEQKTQVFDHSPEKHQRCVACHEVHGPPPTGSVCGGCHEKNAHMMSAAPQRHQDCTQCHAPHAPAAKTPVVCAECHLDPVRKLVATGPKQHQNDGCLTCHRPHGSPSAGSKACGNCHRDKVHATQRAAPRPHQQCSSCHASHEFSKSQASCGSCHAQLVTADASHQGSCTTCHAPHGSPEVRRDACISCHTKDHSAPLPRVKAHADCSSCHQPHQRAKAALAQCGNCHKNQITVAQLWPKGSAHAGPCNACHTPHDEKQIQACSTCHAPEATSAHGGRHQCQTCHAPHKPPASGSGWWQGCAGCHEREAKTSTKHAPCNSCHQPHQFAQPSCNSCHANIRSKAAHGMKGHSECKKCHDTHSASIPTRAQCLSCHTTLQNHKPGAPRCQSCHPFK